MRLAMPARPGLTQNVLLVSVVFPGGGVVGRLDLPGEGWNMVKWGMRYELYCIII